MTSTILYQTKRLLRVWDSRWTRKTKEVYFRDHRFRFYSTYWRGDISQALLESEIAPDFNAYDESFTPRTILDVGAATGHFSLLAAKLYPRSTVYAFEPSERQQILLTRNAKLNGIENLEVQPFGLWNRRDQLAFRTNGAESSFESVSRFRGQLPFLESVPVNRSTNGRKRKKFRASISSRWTPRERNSKFSRVRRRHSNAFIPASSSKPTICGTARGRSSVAPGCSARKAMSLRNVRARPAFFTRVRHSLISGIMLPVEFRTYFRELIEDFPGHVVRARREWG